MVKHEVINKYGGKCNCCGEKEILFLTIDHINNDGTKDRDNKSYTTFSFYLKLKKELVRDDLQILCFNCNLGKQLNNGICPHKHINKILLPTIDGRRISNFNIGTKIEWPEDDILIEMCNSSSISEVSKKLGVNFSTISGRLKRRNKYHLVNKRNSKDESKKEKGEREV